MNAERLHAIAIALNVEMTQHVTVRKLQELINALQTVVTESHASNQQQLANNLKTMYAAVTDTDSDSFSPAWRQILDQMGGADLFGASLRSTIEAIFARNQITPAVALPELQQLHKRLQAFKSALEQCTAGLGALNIGNEVLQPGQCEIGLLIPRTVVSNQLLPFAAELKELAFILNTFSEVSTGKKDSLEIRTISSTDLLVYLQAAAPYAACLAVAIERVVAMYKQLLEIRKLQIEIRQQGIPSRVAEEIEEYANQIMASGIEMLSTELVEQFHKKKDEGRKNELVNAVRIALNKIANRIDKGYNLEVRCEPLEPKVAADKSEKELEKAIKVIQSSTANMQFMKLEGPPILKLPESPTKPKA